MHAARAVNDGHGVAAATFDAHVARIHAETIDLVMAHDDAPLLIHNRASRLVNDPAVALSDFAPFLPDVVDAARVLRLPPLFSGLRLHRHLRHASGGGWRLLLIRTTLDSGWLASCRRLPWLRLGRARLAGLTGRRSPGLRLGTLWRRLPGCGGRLPGRGLARLRLCRRLARLSGPRRLLRLRCSALMRLRLSGRLRRPLRAGLPSLRRLRGLPWLSLSLLRL